MFWWAAASGLDLIQKSAVPARVLVLIRTPTCHPPAVVSGSTYIVSPLTDPATEDPGMI